MIITGPSSGGGKDSVARKVEKKGNFKRIVTYTTRDQRPGEKEGGDLHFISKEEFLEKERNGFFLETNRLATKKKGNFYGSPKNEVLEALKNRQDVLLRVDVNGAREIKRQMSQTVVIFIYATMEEMKRRLIKRRREGIAEILKKLALANKELKAKDENFVDYRVHNKDGKLEEAVEKVLEIIERRHVGKTLKI